MKNKISRLFPVLFIFFAAAGCNGVDSQSCLYRAGDSPAKLKKIYKRQENAWQDRLGKNPRDRQLRMKLAGFYYGFRDYRKAEDTLKGWNYKEAKTLLAKTLIKQKKYDYAIELYQELEPDLEDPEAFFLFGEVLEEKNLFPQAIDIYQKVEPPFQKQARQRIKSIQKKVEQAIPPKIKELKKQAGEFLQEFEEEAAVLLFVDETIEIFPNQTSISSVHVIKRVQKERGKESAEVKIGYDSTYERVELEYARTVTADGKVVYAGEENIRDVSRYLDFPLYSNSRAFIVSMPAVGLGAFIEYKFKIHSAKLIDKDNFNFIYRLREEYPVFKAAFKLITPESKNTHFKFFNQSRAGGRELSPSHSLSRGRNVYTWNFSRLKPIVSEYSMPPSPYFNPAVLISSFSSWEDIYKWWSRLYQDKLALTPEIKKVVGDLAAGGKSDLDKAEKIYEYVARNIRYVAVEYGDSGYQPHSAEEVFINKYGDCKDQAVLLTAMLKAAGLDAYPVLIPTRSSYPISEDFPSVNFNHAITALAAGKNFIFMDPTSNTTPFGEIPLSDQGRKVLLFLPDGWQIAETPVSSKNGVAYFMDITLRPGQKALVKRRVSPFGYFASAYRSYLMYSHPSRIKEDIQEKMTSICPFSQLIDYKIKDEKNLDKDPVLTYTFSAEDFLNPAGPYRILGPLDQIDLQENLAGKGKRNFPIDFGGIFSHSARIKVNLVPELEVEYLPDSRYIENQWFKFKTDYKTRGAAVFFYQDFSLKKRFVDEGGYQKFREDFKKALYYLKAEAILKEKGEKNK